MPTALEELHQRRSLLEGLNFELYRARLGELYTWLDATPAAKAVIARLEKDERLANLVADASPEHRPDAGTPEQVAAIGLALMRMCRDGETLDIAAIKLGAAAFTRQVQVVADSAFRDFVDPALEYIARRIDAEAGAPSSDDLVDRRLASICEASLAVGYPGTLERLNAVAREFGETGPDGQWFNVANSCREILKTFASEVRAALPEPEADEAKKGDVKAAIRIAFGSSGSSRFRATAVNMLCAVWDHLQPMLHRETTSREEAVRAYVWTALAVAEVARETSVARREAPPAD